MLVDTIDFFRLDANRKLDPGCRSELGQFMTPPATTRLMASMFRAEAANLVLLDAGAGVGSLTAAFVAEVCGRDHKPQSIDVTAYEIDSALIEYLHATLDQCRKACDSEHVAFEPHLVNRDFIEDAARKLRQEMFTPVKRFNCAILNPPYKKISSNSEMRTTLRELGVETSNLYTGFLAIVLKLLADGGELVAITPRSFCNGPYFKPFRKLLLEALAIRRIHVFESRQVTFREDDVLQENVIFYGVKGGSKGNVVISSSTGPEDDLVVVNEVKYEQVVRPGDPEHFIHIVPDELGASAGDFVYSVRPILHGLGLDVSSATSVLSKAQQDVHR